MLLLRLEQNQEFSDNLKLDIETRNCRLPDFKRVSGYLIWERDFPRTTSLKIKRNVLAEEVGRAVERSAVVDL